MKTITATVLFVMSVSFTDACMKVYPVDPGVPVLPGGFTKHFVFAKIHSIIFYNW